MAGTAGNQRSLAWLIPGDQKSARHWASGRSATSITGRGAAGPAAVALLDAAALSRQGLPVLDPTLIPPDAIERGKHCICSHSPPLWKPPLTRTPMGFVSSGPAPMPSDSVSIHYPKTTRSGFWKATSSPVSTGFRTIGFWLTSPWIEPLSESG